MGKQHLILLWGLSYLSWLYQQHIARPQNKYSFSNKEDWKTKNSERREAAENSGTNKSTAKQGHFISVSDCHYPEEPKDILETSFKWIMQFSSLNLQ